MNTWKQILQILNISEENEYGESRISETVEGITITVPENTKIALTNTTPIFTKEGLGYGNKIHINFQEDKIYFGIYEKSITEWLGSATLAVMGMRSR